MIGRMRSRSDLSAGLSISKTARATAHPTFGGWQGSTFGRSPCFVNCVPYGQGLFATPVLYVRERLARCRYFPATGAGWSTSAPLRVHSIHGEDSRGVHDPGNDRRSFWHLSYCWSMDSGCRDCGSYGGGLGRHYGHARTIGPGDVSDTQLYDRNDRTWCVVHRRPDLRKEAYSNTASPQKVVDVDLPNR